MRDPGIDIVTRLYDLADLPCLDRLMLSVMAQTNAMPLRLHIMLQRFSFTEVQAVREALHDLRRLQDQVSVTLHNWDYPAPFDLTVPLLNWGLEVAQSRYFIVLDIYDQFYPHACTALLTRLRNTIAAIALGGTVRQSVLWWGDVVLPIPDQEDTPSPPPLFMIDRHRLASKDCIFRSDGDPAEEFIARIGTTYEVDTKCQIDIVALRQHPE